MRKIFITALFIIPATIHADRIDSLLQVIQSNNLELKALSCENQSRQYEMQSENKIGGPTVEYSPFYTRGVHGIASSELIVSQEFEFPTRYSQRRQQIKLQTEADDSQWEVTRRQILLEARLICYDIVRQDQLIELLNERLKQGENTTILIQKRLQVGDGTALELNKARLEQMQTAQQLTEARNERLRLAKQLQILNGGKEIEAGHLSYPTPLQNHEINLGELTPYTTENLPEIAQAEKTLRASQNNERLTKQEWLPNISVGYRRNTEENVKLNGFMIGASFPLFSNASKQKAVRKQIEADKLRLDKTIQEAETMQKTRYEELELMHSVLDHSDTSLLHETLTLLDKALQHGQISALEYYIECNDIYEKLTNHINMHAEFVKLYTELYLR